jgi:hypothetical protein
MSGSEPQFSRITFNFQGMHYFMGGWLYNNSADQPQKEASIACKLISEAIALRKKYVFTKGREDWSPAPENVLDHTQVFLFLFVSAHNLATVSLLLLYILSDPLTVGSMDL